MEKIPSPENNEQKEINEIISKYPLPEGYENIDRARLLKIRKSITKKFYEDEDCKSYDLLAPYAKKLKEKYPNASDYWTYNVLIGSTGKKQKNLIFLLPTP
jgi:ABC-type glycerol-3-phosphate transport system substrate-binding protein